MSLRTVAIIGWACLTLDALFVLSLFVMKNAGDDAAGRGMAQGFAFMLAPVLLLAGGGLFWAQRSGSFAGVIAATLIVALPFLMVARNVSSLPLRAVERAIQRSGRGKFDDRRLTEMASAIEARDTARLAAVAKEGGVDWTARDRKGRTIFGIAVEQAMTQRDEQPLTMLKTLVDAGARYQDDAAGEKTRIFPTLLDDTGDQHLPLLELLLIAGANPNDTESDQRPLLLHYNMTVNKAKLLLAHGADVTGARDNREDRPGWDALMNATYTRNWPLAIFYLEHGFDTRYKANDGKTVREVLNDVKEEERGAGGAAFEGEYRRFTDVLDARLKATRAGT